MPPCRSVLNTNSQTFGRNSEKCRVQRVTLSISSRNAEGKTLLNILLSIWGMSQSKLERNLSCRTKFPSTILLSRFKKNAGVFVMFWLELELFRVDICSSTSNSPPSCIAHNSSIFV